MLFNTWLYAVFLASVFLLYWGLPFPRVRPYLLILSGIAFYTNYYPAHTPLILGLTVFTACHFALLRGSDRPERLRAAVAFAFGLIHGFGFAGVMMELDLGRVRLVPALFGFNSGVELGQLAVVCVAWPILVALRRNATRGALSAEIGSAAVCGLGLFWFVTRTFG